MTKEWRISFIYYYMYVIGKCSKNSNYKNIRNINKLNVSVQAFLILNATTLVNDRVTLNNRPLILMGIFNTSFLFVK